MTKELFKNRNENSRPLCHVQDRRNLFEHGEDTSFKIVPLAPSKHSTPPVLGRSVNPIPIPPRFLDGWMPLINLASLMQF